MKIHEFQAKRILAESDVEWERIRSLTKAANDAALHALRDAYRAGIPRRFRGQEIEAAQRVFAVLAKEGGAELVGASSSLSPGTFWNGFEISPWPQ